MKTFFWVVGLLAVVFIGARMFSSPPQTVAVDADPEVRQNEVENTLKEDSMEKHDTTYTLQDGSVLNWHAEKIVGNSHDGTVTVKSGELYRDAGEFTGGEFVIDMNTITESNDTEMFLKHIRSEDFFNIEAYPESTLTFTSIEKQEDGSYEITGDLTILGKTNEITFPATIEQEGETIKAQAEFTIDRTKWGITYDSGSIFQQLGDKAIRDEIEYKLELTFSRS